MSEENKYSNREIDTFLGMIDSKLDKIMSKQDYTNGRVRFLEKMVWLASGAIVVLSFFMANNLLTFGGQTLTEKDVSEIVETTLNQHVIERVE